MLDTNSSKEEVREALEDNGCGVGQTDNIHGYVTERMPPDDMALCSMLANDMFVALFFIKEEYVEQRMSGDLWRWMEFLRDELPTEIWGDWDSIINWVGEEEDADANTFLRNLVLERDYTVEDRCPKCRSDKVEWLSFAEFARRCTDKDVSPKCRQTVSRWVDSGQFITNNKGKVPWCGHCEELTPDTQVTI